MKHLLFFLLTLAGLSAGVVGQSGPSTVTNGRGASGTDNRIAALAVLERMLRSGVTAVRDMAGDARTLAGLSRDALVGDIVSPDIYYSALMAGPAFFDDPRTIASAQGGRSGGMAYMRAVTDHTGTEPELDAAFGGYRFGGWVAGAGAGPGWEWVAGYYRVE